LRRRALVSGASGFVGANLARRLLADGHEVHLVLRPGHKPWRLDGIATDVKIHKVDITDREGVRKAMAEARPDWVFHLAAHGAYPTQKDLDQMIETNLRGAANLVDAAVHAEVKAFVNAGTSSEYGYKDHAPSEDEWLEPNSDYAVTKAAATMFCRHVARRTGLPITTLRLYSIYGPFEEPARLVPTLIVQGLEDRLPPLVNPDIARDYIHVDDACEAFVLAAATEKQDPGVVYNVGSGVQTTLREIVASARRILDVKAEPQWGSMQQRSWDTNVWVSNPSKIRARLGWSPRHDLESGLRETVEWFKLHPDRRSLYRAAQA
jgi:nucleoside-diphosphate-sugar epimerase